MKKRLSVLLVVLVMVVAVFTACGAPAEEAAPAKEASAEKAAPAEEAPAEEAAELQPITFIAQAMSNESQAFSSKMFEKYAADYGFDVKIVDAKFDPATEAQLVSTAIAEGSVAIFVNPNDINAIVPSLMEAKDAGVVVGLYSSEFPEENRQYRDFSVCADDYLAGVAGAEAVLAEFPDGAKVVEIGGQSGHDAQIKRNGGFQDTIAGTNIECIEEQSCPDGWVTETAMSIAEGYITKYGDEIDAIFCHWDNGVTGIIQAYKNADVAEEDMPFLVGVDGCRAGFDQVSDGYQTLSLMQNFEKMTTQSLEYARKVLDGEAAPEDTHYLEWDYVTADSIDTFTYPEW